MNLVATTKSQQSTALIDPWTVVHAGTGLGAGLLGIHMGVAIAGAVAYEFLEHRVQTNAQGLNFFNVSRPESLGNQIVDVLVFAGGVYLGHKYNQTG
jgi:hypothetical protein